MSLSLFNSQTRRKEPFVPIDPRRVRMYVCGPTVYDLAHIGNARPVLVFDLLFRFLRYFYGKNHVFYARNITDVDDKITDRARREGSSIATLTEQTTRQFHDDIAQLGALPPTYEPRATDHIPHMIALIEALLARGTAYRAEDHVLFDISAMETYGALSGRSLEDRLAGARVEVAPFKKNPGDFVLWKPSSPDQPGWPSPWGIGRPGWHIECSAMSEAHLGVPFDIHGGGLDLLFPHHENENAQTCCGRGLPKMANLWMHNGFVQVEGRKMSKSLGNFLTIRDILKDWPGPVIRLNMLKTHYRQPLDWTVRGLEESQHILDNWSHRTTALPKNSLEKPPISSSLLDALGDDLNTPKAMETLHRLEGPDLFVALELLGLEPTPITLKESDHAGIEALVAERLIAKNAGDFQKADQLRDSLSERGVTLQDARENGTWITTWQPSGRR